MNSRLQAIGKIVSEASLDALVIQNKTDLLWATGLHLSAGTLLVSCEGTSLIVDGRYYELAKEAGGLPVILESEGVFKRALEPYSRIGFDGSTLSWEQASHWMSTYPDHKWQSLPSPLKTLRAVKDAEEIKKMRRAADLGSKGFDILKTLLREGIEERELMLKLELFWKEQGGQGVAFEPIIAFGANSAFPHYRAGKGVLKRGDTVLLDIGVIVDDYHSDMTRTLFFGEPPPLMKEIYLATEEAQKGAIDKLAPGVTAGELDQVARASIEKRGFGDLFTHGLGHGVGLEIHEWPFLKNKEPYASAVLEAGMCVTIEPGIYKPGLGGVRLEDTYLVGGDSLTKRSTALSEAIIHA